MEGRVRIDLGCLLEVRAAPSSAPCGSCKTRRDSRWTHRSSGRDEPPCRTPSQRVRRTRRLSSFSGPFSFSPRFEMPGQDGCGRSSCRWSRRPHVEKRLCWFSKWRPGRTQSPPMLPARVPPRRPFQPEMGESRRQFRPAPDQHDVDADHRDIGVAIGHALSADLDQPDNGHQRAEIPEPAHGQVRPAAEIPEHEHGNGRQHKPAPRSRTTPAALSPSSPMTARCG